MVSERTQRRIDQFLNAADEAAARLDWDAVKTNAEAVLRLDPTNADALTYLRAGFPAGEAPALRELPARVEPETFVNGRYQVKRLLGEGGKKRVYLAGRAPPATGPAGGGDRPAGLPGVGVRAPSGAGAPRPEARERLAHRGWDR
jgi:hypothetical protein